MPNRCHYCGREAGVPWTDKTGITHVSVFVLNGAPFGLNICDHCVSEREKKREEQRMSNAREAMERLTETAKWPLTTFNRCQLCGFASDDICEFTMWQECDEKDKPEPYRVIVLCRSDQCMTELRDHPRLYREVPWGRGRPGHAMLICGPCRYREGAYCKHPSLKANGGNGLNLYLDGSLPKVMVCYHNENDEDGYGLTCDPNGFPNPYIDCDGLKEEVV